MITAFLILCLAASNLAKEMRGIAVLTTGEAKGTVLFIEEDGITRITGVIEGLKPGLHGFHVHEKADLSSGCTSTGSHYNPHKKQHGGPEDAERHIGDLGNIKADDKGVANFTLTDKLVMLSGEYSVLGRAVVVHSDPDDLGHGGFSDSLTTGHAGSRVGCGIIGIL